MTKGLGEGLDFDDLVGNALVSELGRRLAEVELKIAKLTDRSAQGDVRADVDLLWEYSRKEKIELWLESATNERGGRHGA
jgi:hypothetical protein